MHSHTDIIMDPSGALALSLKIIGCYVGHLNRNVLTSRDALTVHHRTSYVKFSCLAECNDIGEGNLRPGTVRRARRTS